MKKLTFLISLFLFVFGFQLLLAQTENNKTKFSFDDVKIGQLPDGWIIEATNQKGPLATWKVVEDKSAPSENKVLALTSINHDFGGTFNLCLTKENNFKNGVIQVMFKAHTGEEDQGGGVIWRVQDKANYYVARFNPLEDNFRIYYVKEEARKILASARIKLSTKEWQQLKIVQSGKHIIGYLNGNKLLEVDDDTFTKPGGVGLWTKADAVTSFDNFEIEFSK